DCGCSSAALMGGSLAHARRVLGASANAVDSCSGGVEAPKWQMVTALEPVLVRIGRRRVDDMEGEGVAAAVAAVHIAPMGQESMQKNECALLGFDRDEGIATGFGKWGLVEYFEARTAFGMANEAGAERATMSARFGPEATIFDGCIFEGDLETN